MKNIIILASAVALAIAIPYLVVGVAWLCSLGAFEYRATVTSDGFYAVAAIYWICFSWMIPASISEAYCD